MQNTKWYNNANERTPLHKTYTSCKWYVIYSDNGRNPILTKTTHGTVVYCDGGRAIEIGVYLYSTYFGHSILVYDSDTEHQLEKLTEK